MPITTYVYNKQVNPITLRESIENAPNIVIGVNNVQINSDNSVVSAIMKDVLPISQEATLSGIVDDHTYTTMKDDYIFDKEGKLIVHQTIRPPGFHTYFTGVGDDVSDISNVGGGENIYFLHNVGDPLSGIKYVDFNVVTNKTYVYEGYVSWNDTKMVDLTVEVVSIAPTYNIVSGGTTFDIYGGYLIIPSANGIVDITSDLTNPVSGGLVYMPKSNDGTRPQAFWDADWNSTTLQYENIVPNYNGTGEYNIFAGEVPITRFINSLNLAGRGSQKMDSEDAEEIGQGMRFKFTYNQHPSVTDNDWSIGCTMTLHRQKTV